MKSRYKDSQLITLGTYGFEQQYLFRNGYKVVQKNRINGSSFVLAKKDKIRILFLLRIFYKGEVVIDSSKRTKKDNQKTCHLLVERAKMQGALPAFVRLDFDEDVRYLLEKEKPGKFSIIEVDDETLYMSQPLAKLEYRTPYE